MSDQFFEKPILNSPYECPERHWELDPSGQPTQHIIESRRSAEFITPIPKPKKRKSKDVQPGVNNLANYGRWAFVEFTDVYEMQNDFAEKVEAEFNKMIAAVDTDSPALEANT